MHDINNLAKKTGRYLKENNQAVNMADMIEAIYKALVVTKNAGMQVANTAPIDARLAGNGVIEHTFHNAATEIANGTPFDVGGYKTLTVEISGTSTERSISFIGRGPSGEDRNIAGVRLSDLALATSTKGTKELWQFDITGLVSVIMDLVTVSGGNVTVKGMAVA